MRGFTNECRGGDCETLTGIVVPASVEEGDDYERQRNDDSGSESSESDSEEGDSDQESTRKPGRVRRTKPDAALKDQQSTGRKRAARLYPLPPKNSPQPCEWQGKVRMGGGTNPVTGCFDGIQLARHHGPDKNTLNNDPGNVHRICHHCHNRWHAANDPDYDPNKPLKH